MVARGFVLLALAACAPTPRHAIAVGVLVDGDAAPIAPRAVPGLELHAVELPVAPPPRDEVTGALTRARTAFATGDTEACRRELAAIDVAALLAAGHRTAAARALAVAAGCAFQASALDEVRAIAARFATYRLELPAQIVGYEVEQLIGEAIEAVNRLPRHRVVVRGEPGARVALDGLPARCTVPCPLALAPGDHVIALEADGFEPAWRTVRVPDTARGGDEPVARDPAPSAAPPRPPFASLTAAASETTREIAIALQPASAARAAAQWRARIGRGLPATDATGAGLLALASRTPRLAYLEAGDRLAGAMIVDGARRATGTAPRGEAPSLLRELAYDAGILPRPRVWQRPWFWIAVSGVALATAGTIAYVTYEPDIQTRVGFFE